MERPPRPRSEGVIRGPMLVRAWLFLGVIVARCSRGRLLLRPDSRRLAARAIPSAPAHPLHHAYLQATTMTFVGMIAGQIGTAFAVRTERASLRSIGVFSNRYLLLWGSRASWSLAAVFIYAPPLQIAARHRRAAAERPACSCCPSRSSSGARTSCAATSCGAARRQRSTRQVSVPTTMLPGAPGALVIPQTPRQARRSSLS